MYARVCSTIVSRSKAKLRPWGAPPVASDYVALVREGHVFNNGDLNSLLRVVTADEETSLRGLVESGKQRSFGKKVVSPKTITQRRYVDAIDRNDMVFGVGPAGTGKTYLAVAMAVSALLAKRVSHCADAPRWAGAAGCLPGTLQEKVDHISGRSTMRCTTCWRRRKSRN